MDKKIKTSKSFISDEDKNTRLRSGQIKMASKTEDLNLIAQLKEKIKKLEDNEKLVGETVKISIEKIKELTVSKNTLKTQNEEITEENEKLKKEYNETTNKLEENISKKDEELSELKSLLEENEKNKEVDKSTKLDNKVSKNEDKDIEEKSKTWMDNLVKKLHETMELANASNNGYSKNQGGNKLPNSQPIFSGEKLECASIKDNVENWIYITETNIKVAEIPDQKKVTIASTHLRGTALNEFKTWIKSEQNLSWADFKAKMIARFLPPDFINQLRVQVHELTMKDDITDFSEKYTALVTKLNYPTDIAISEYVEKLTPRTKNQLKLNKVPSTLMETIIRATQIKNSLDAEKPTTFIGYTNTNMKQCTFCGRKNHLTEDCWIKNTKEGKLNNYTPNRNSQTGRFQSQNFNKPYQYNQNNNFRGNNYNQNYKNNQGQYQNQNNYQNFKNKNNQKWQTFNNHSKQNGQTFNNKNNQSGQNFNKGHHGIQNIEINHIEDNQTIIKECSDHLLNNSKSTPQFHCNMVNTSNDINAMDEDQNFATTMATIGGNRIKSIFDTGAKISVIPLQFALDKGFKIESSNSQCILGDGSKINNNGIVKSMNINIYNRSCEIDFIVLPRNNHIALIGVDWFVKNEAYVILHNNPTLVFENPDERFILNSKETDFDDQELFQLDIDEPYLKELEDLIIHYDQDKKPTYKYIIEQVKNLELDDSLTPEQQSKVKKLIIENSDVFANSTADLKKPCNLGAMKINTTSNLPIRQLPYRKSYIDREKIKNQVKDLIEAGLIRPSDSPWSSPVVMVKKRDGDSRFCIDYRKLNNITISDPFPIHRLEDIFDDLAGSEYYTCWDCKSGYWQGALDEGTVPLTAFTTPDGHYEWLRVPFGLKNAPAFFCRLMFQIFGNCQFMETFFDDMTAHSKNFEDHLRDIKEAFQLIRKANLKLNFSKCQWFKKEVKVLGHIISKFEKKMDPNKISIIQNWPTPKKIRDVQSFLGLPNFYRKFIKDFAKMQVPLNNLLKKETKWNWTQECEESFLSLKKAICSYPILRQVDPNLQFVLYTDASGFALGAVLMQIDLNDNLYMVACFSRVLKGAEIHYGTTDKECLGIAFGIKESSVYLQGKHFILKTDHWALKWMMSIKNPTGRIARTIMYVQSFTFTIEHVPGKNMAADTPSRAEYTLKNPISLIDISKFEDISSKDLDPYEDEVLLHYLKTGRFLPGSSKKQCKRAMKAAEHYKIDEEGSIWHSDNTEGDFDKIVPQVKERIPLIKNSHLLGHFAFEKTYEDLISQFYWKGMAKDIKFLIDNCLICLRFHNIPILEHNAIALPITDVIDRVGIDLVFGLPRTEEGYIGVLVITDYLTKFPYVIPIKSKSMIEICEGFFGFICLFGPPKELLSDQGKEFLNKMIENLVKVVGIDHRITSAYHPRTNGLTERFNQRFIRALMKLAEENPICWNKWIPFVLLAYRTRVQKSTKFTPFETMFGRKMNSFIRWDSVPTNNESSEIIKRAFAIKKQFEVTIPKVKENIEKAQINQKVSQNKQHKIRVEALPKGSKVFMKYPQKIRGKLEPNYQGPYIVDKQSPNGNYWLLNKNGIRLKNAYPLSRLKMVPDTVPMENIRKVEYITNMRVRNDTKEYLVKYVEKDETDTSWIPESEITDTILIENYMNSQNTGEKV